MAAFKGALRVRIREDSLVPGGDSGGGRGGPSQFGRNDAGGTSRSWRPYRLIRKAMNSTSAGINSPARPQGVPRGDRGLPTPEVAPRGNPRQWATFEGVQVPRNRREYVYGSPRPGPPTTAIAGLGNGVE